MPRVIRFDDTCIHALKPAVLRIVRGTYETFDPNNCPITFDSFYHVALLSYEPKSPEDLEPRRIYIIMREGEPGLPDAKVRFVLNVLSNKVHDRVASVFVATPEHIEALLGVVRDAVRKFLQEEAARMLIQDENVDVDAKE
ncbi:hypothetical protein NM688_g5087 [Phlebia brevispora]|uniref:Uncharacterized protein n=1 Tax=Phlebia brevispora TaxID=194682 RepID=A0ACC1T192_9APHY|nr:hypothetical protein NM688_g5087 [Phlebia brevispora]